MVGLIMFFITCFSQMKRTRGSFDGGAVRTFGFYETLDDAERALNVNSCDLHECLYKYAVVEKMEPAIHPYVEQEVWFKWDEDRQGFFRISKPKETEHYCNFALG